MSQHTIPVEQMTLRQLNFQAALARSERNGRILIASMIVGTLLGMSTIGYGTYATLDYFFGS